MKEIRRAENAGFCFGVKQAIEKAEKAAEDRQTLFLVERLTV